MIKTSQFEYRDPSGTWYGEITAVELEPNRFYDPDKKNSTEETLTIVFQLTNMDDPEDQIVHSERFVAPLLGDKRLLQQLVDCLGIEIQAGDNFNEDVLVGEKMDVTIELNNKGFARVAYVAPLSQKKAAPIKTGTPAGKKVAPKKVVTPAAAEEDTATEEVMPWEEGQEENA